MYKYFTLIQIMCEVMGSDLVAINSKEENNFIVNYLKTNLTTPDKGMFIFTK